MLTISGIAKQAAEEDLKGGLESKPSSIASTDTYINKAKPKAKPKPKPKLNSAEVYTGTTDKSKKFKKVNKTSIKHIQGGAAGVTSSDPPVKPSSSESYTGAKDTKSTGGSAGSGAPSSPAQKASLQGAGMAAPTPLTSNEVYTQGQEAKAQARPAPTPKAAPAPAAPAAPAGNRLQQLLQQLKSKFNQGTARVPGLNKLKPRGRAGAIGAGIAGLSGLGYGLTGGAPAPAPVQAAAPVAAPAAPAVPTEPQQAGMGESVMNGGGRILEWIKANPGKAGLLGLGGAGLGYGLYNSLSGDEEEKYGKDQFIKKASANKRHNAVRMINTYLNKKAEDATVFEKRAFARIQASLISGDNINTAVKKALPTMGPERRGIFASNLVKHAVDDFTKEAMHENGPMSYSGPVSGGQDWMKRNTT
jgi:hypothetical protein